jgi:YHS domain-containing protein
MNKLVKDPVCGMDVDPQTNRNSLHHAVYKDKEFYFCSPFCKAVFLENPESYTDRGSKNYKNGFVS